MKEQDLLTALDGVRDEFLLEAEAAPAAKVRPRRFSLRWVAIAAAIVAILTITAVAVGQRVSVTPITQSIQERSLVNEYYRSETDEVNFSQIDIDFDLAPITIREEAYEEICDWLTDGWETGGRRSRVYNSIEEVEAYLGIQLRLSPKMRQDAAQYMGAQQPSVLFFYQGSDEKCQAEYAETGRITPTGILITFYMSDDYSEYDTIETMDLVGDQALGFIFIALSEDYPKIFDPYPMVSYEREGPVTVADYPLGSLSATLIHNDPEPTYNGSAHITYSADGMGYLISTWDFHGDGDALELLKPYLEGYE